MRHIRWVGVVLGALTTVALTSMFLAFVSLVVQPLLSTVTGIAPVDGVTSVTVVQERIHGLLIGLFVLSSLLSAFFFGGLTASAA